MAKRGEEGLIGANPEMALRGFSRRGVVFAPEWLGPTCSDTHRYLQGGTGEANGLMAICLGQADASFTGVRNPPLPSKKEREGRLYTEFSKELGIKRLDLRILASEKLAPIPMG